MKELIIFISILMVFLGTFYVYINYFTFTKNKEQYIDLGDEITSEVQTAAAANLTSALPKLNTIKTDMATTNTSLNNIITSQTTALGSITSTVTDDISKLTSINNRLKVSIKKVKNLINGTVIPVTETFENVSDIYDNSKQKKQNTMNNKEKLTEYFYNYVPPKQNIYEGFFDWRDDWNRKVSEIGLSLHPTSDIVDGKYNDILPIIYKPGMPVEMEKTAAKLISLAATDDSQELLKSWRKSLRN